MSKRWQYVTVEVKPTWRGLDATKIQEQLNRHGQLGWELVNAIYPGTMHPVMLFFKKEI